MNMFRANVLPWWQGRAEREQIMLVVMGALMAVVLVQVAVIQPLLAFHAQSNRNYAASIENTREFETGISEYNRLLSSSDQAIVDSQPLRTIVGQLALSEGIAITRMTPSDNGQLTVNIASAPLSSLLAWLVEMETRHGIEIVSSSLDRVSENMTEAHIVLQRRGS